MKSRRPDSRCRSWRLQSEADDCVGLNVSIREGEGLREAGGACWFISALLLMCETLHVASEGHTQRARHAGKDRAQSGDAQLSPTASCRSVNAPNTLCRRSPPSQSVCSDEERVLQTRCRLSKYRLRFYDWLLIVTLSSSPPRRQSMTET